MIHCNEHLQVTIHGLKDCVAHWVTLQLPQRDFSFKFYLVLAGGGGEVARVEGRWEGTGR